MKIKILFVALAVLSAIFLSSCSSTINPLSGKETTSLFPMRQNGKNGYINSKGEIIIQPQFDFTLPFSEGLAVVCIYGGKCGYIDETGKFAINPQFDFASRFSEGLAAVIIENRLGYIDKSGKFVINPQFTPANSGPGMMDSFSTFSEGLARVKIGEKFGFIDKTGKIVINPQFDEALPFLDDLAAAKIGDKWGFVDKEGKILINPQFEYAQPFVNGLAVVKVGNQYGYIDKTGKIAINPQFDFALPFSEEGLAVVALNQKIGFIDKDGKYTVNPQFGYSAWFGSVSILERAFLVTSDLGRLSFSEGLTPVQVGDKRGNVGYADKTGKIVINPQFEEALPFYGGIAIVFTGGPNGVGGWIDKEGKCVWRETKESINNPLNTTNTNANTAIISNYNSGSNMAINTNAMAVNANAVAMNYNNATSSSQKIGRLTTDSNIRSEANKDAASLGIHFKGAKISITNETSYTNEKGELTTWYRIKVTEYGCSANTSLGCGKNTPNDADEGWVNAKNILLD